MADPELPHKMGYKILEGTSDAIADGSCERYQKRATEYARRLNIHLLTLLSISADSPRP